MTYCLLKQELRRDREIKDSKILEGDHGSIYGNIDKALRQMVG
jgi:hypothetical protein